MTETIGEMIVDRRQDNDELRRLFGELGGPGSGVTWYKVEEDKFRINATSAIVKTRGLGSSFILGHPGLGWLGAEVAGSAAVGSQPYLGDSRGSFAVVRESGDSMVYTNLGRDWVIDALIGNNPTAPSHMAFGSSGTAAASGDTALGSEINNTTAPFESSTSGARYIEYEGIVVSTEPSGLQPIDFQEVGIFTGSPTSSGSLVARSTFAALEKSIDLELQTLYRIEVD